MGLDVSTLEAIDVHVHIEVDAHGHLSLPDDQAEAAAQYFGADHRSPTLPEIAAQYRERRMGAVVFTVDTESCTGHPAISNEEIAEGAAEHADVLVPFASIDPAKGRAGARALRTLVERHGVRGLKFHPSAPVITPDRWLADFDQLEIKPAVRPKILKQNAVRVLGLA